MRRYVRVAIVLLLMMSSLMSSQTRQGTFENSLVIAPLYVDLAMASAEKFAKDAATLKTTVGSAPYVLLGFASFLRVQYPAVPIDRKITEADMAPSLAEADLIVKRAADNGLVTHMSIVSGFFHSYNELRYSAVQEDARNAQWFADGLIAEPADLRDPTTVPRTVWVTPSRYADPLHTRIEEGARILGAHLAGLMARNPNTFLTVSGDGETEFSWERNLTEEGSARKENAPILYTDYSPFTIAEFRDWIHSSRYNGDLTPETDENGDGKTFNRDFSTTFKTWQLKYFDNSGPIPFADYVRLPEKMPTTGRYAIPEGFDAPRVELDSNPYWRLWMEFRQEVIRNWNRDFATWITTSPDPATGYRIPPARYYTHQIPGDLIFGDTDNPRLRMSASPIKTAVIDPIGSTGVTAFNGFDGRKHVKTATPELYSNLYMTSDNWGIMEYNPSMPYAPTMPPSNDLRYYMTELRMLQNFHPHVLIPFAWSDYPQHKHFNIQGSTFEKALKQFVKDVGNTPWFSWRAKLRGQ